MRANWKMFKSKVEVRVRKNNFMRIRKDYSANIGNSPKKV